MVTFSKVNDTRQGAAVEAFGDVPLIGGVSMAQERAGQAHAKLVETPHTVMGAVAETLGAANSQLRTLGAAIAKGEEKSSSLPGVDEVRAALESSKAIGGDSSGGFIAVGGNKGSIKRG